MTIGLPDCGVWTTGEWNTGSSAKGMMQVLTLSMTALSAASNVARDLKVDYVLSNSLGFGGHNTSLLLGRI
mgnify:CR=1 FL=1